MPACTLTVGHGFGEAERGVVYPDRIGDLSGIPSGHGNRDRQAMRPAACEDGPVAFGQTVEGQGQAPQAVVLVRVGASQIDDQIGAGQAEGGVQPFVQP